MSASTPDDLSGLSMTELFRVEVENQTGVMTASLLELERNPGAPKTLETLMRAAHSLKGAARIVDLGAAVRLAHAMEDCFVAAQRGKVTLRQAETDLLLRGVDLLGLLAKGSANELSDWEKTNAAAINSLLKELSTLNAKASLASPDSAPQQRKAAIAAPTSEPPAADRKADAESDTTSFITLGAASEISNLKSQIPNAPATSDPNATMFLRRHEASDRVVRLNAENLNRLLALAGESLVESRWLHPFTQSMFRLKRMQMELAHLLDDLRQTLREDGASDRARVQFRELMDKVGGCGEYLDQRLEEMDLFDRRSARLSHRLYREVLRTRMRPFGDGIRRFPRMVRDLALSLGKEVRLEIVGEKTQVDRDILEKLESPLTHLIRNALDHGCEAAAARQRAGKPAESVVRLEARHSAGMLLITVADDGSGIDPERVRERIIQRKLSPPDVARRMSEAELLEFLFLPGFTMKDTVTEISGRGVGLDVVQNMVRTVRGSIRAAAKPGKGTRFQLQLPLTLSVLRTLLVDIGGEPYAIPLGQIDRTLKLPAEKIETLEGRQHFRFDGQHVGLISGSQVLECPPADMEGEQLPVVVLSERATRYGLVVDRFLGERELVVQPLDTRLGKVQNISAAALMEDGLPVLIMDVEDVIRSVDKLLAHGRIAGISHEALAPHHKRRKRILAVDDSLTVRELERKLLANRGYHADVAVDGIDGWNAVRSGGYDLIITDVDMPRLDGIELTTLIKKDPQLKSLPVMIVSYKDREEDRMRGLDAGADYYLTKGSFHDETLLQAVADLIGEPET